MMPCDLPETPERASLPLDVEGGCHCGNVRFRATIRSHDLSECNCSMCTKKAYLHVIVPRDDFALLTGEDALATYRFNTGVAAHHFRKTCGVHSFYVPRSHPDGVSLNARCLDDVDVAWFDHVDFDGRNWEANIGKLR